MNYPINLELVFDHADELMYITACFHTDAQYIPRTSMYFQHFPSKFEIATFVAAHRRMLRTAVNDQKRSIILPINSETDLKVLYCAVNTPLNVIKKYTTWGRSFPMNFHDDVLRTLRRFITARFSTDG